MTDPFPPNPFHRPPENNDSRESKLFATGGGSSYTQDFQTPNDPQKRNSNSYQISSRRELRIKRSEIRRNILIVISVLIGLIFALIATDTWKLGTGPKPTFSQSLQSIPKEKSETVKVEGKQIEFIRELSNNDPLRVYIGGDSLVGSYGRDLATSLGETGVVKAVYDSRVSSGLVNREFFNWNSHIKQMMKLYNPELVIFQIGTNDASVVSSNPTGYETHYKNLLDSFLEALDSEKRKVVFVLSPAMKSAKLNRNVSKLNTVISNFAKDNSAYIFDSGEVLSPNGSFASVLGSKKKVTIRSNDGIHINGKGGEILAKAIDKFLKESFVITEYSTDETIKPIKVYGCCKTPFTSTTTSLNSSNMTSSSTSSTTTTSIPETALTLPNDEESSDDAPTETASNSE